MMMRKIITLIATLAFIGTASLLVAADKQTIVIGTGNSLAVYDELGSSLCQAVNQKTSMHGISCKTDGMQESAVNIQNLRAGRLGLALIRSDWHSYAYEGSHLFADAGAFEDLRTLVSFHPYSFTVLVRADADVDTFYDLRGKRVNLGPKGSEVRAIMEKLITGYRWSPSSFASVSELEQEQQLQALCDSEIDAAIYLVHHPASPLMAAMGLCPLKLVRVDGNPVRRLVGANPDYRWVSIPAGSYEGQGSSVRTFGVAVKLVGSSSLAEDTAYALTQAVFSVESGLAEFLPSSLTEVSVEALAVPLHAGAMKYYEEMKM